MRITKRQLKKIIREQLSSNNSGDYLKYTIKKEISNIFETYMKKKGFGPSDKIEYNADWVNFTWDVSDDSHWHKKFQELAKEIDKFWSWLRVQSSSFDYLRWYDADDEEKNKINTLHCRM